MTGPIRLLVVDDSEIFTASVTAAAAADGRIAVAGVAHDGLEALALARSLMPDVISMDVHMPVLGGVEAVERIMDEAPAPIVMVTGAATSEMAGISFRAIGAGALDVLPKPAGAGEMRALLGRLALLAKVTVARRPRRGTPPAPRPSVDAQAAVLRTASGAAGLTPVASMPSAAAGRVQALGVAISTGGPPLLEAALRALPKDYPVPILLVQHLSPGFAGHLVEWLAHTAGVRVELAADGVRAQPGVAYLAPHDAHLGVRMGGHLALDAASERVAGHRPSGNVLLASLARVYGSRAAGLVLTGMGSDGAEGLLALRRAGGITGAQDAATSAVDGMPKSARDLGAAEYVVPAPEVAQFLLRCAAR